MAGKFTSIAFIASLGLFIVSEAMVVNATPISLSHGSEVSLIGTGGILDQLYGLGNLTRIDDEVDQIWNGGSAETQTTAMAKFAGYNHNFGYIEETSSGFDASNFVSLFNVTGNGIDLGAPNAARTIEGDFVWALNPSGAPTWTSVQSQNRDRSLDHMVTWRISGNGNGYSNTVGNYVIAWEDLPGGGDRDFNDLVVEVGGGVASVPEPRTMLLFGTGLAALAGLRMKRKK